jgi:hypothetical protein
MSNENQKDAVENVEKNLTLEDLEAEYGEDVKGGATRVIAPGTRTCGDGQ